MRVITERDLLTLLRKKEIEYRGTYEVEVPYVITPSAKSLLRDKQILLVEKNVPDTSHNMVNEVSSEKNTINELPDKSDYGDGIEIHDAVSQLIQLLYFPLLPDDFFSPLVWQYIEKQQDQLRRWQESDFTSPLDNIIWSYPGEKFNFRCCSWRTWQYSVGEINRQINRVEWYMKSRDCSKTFGDWANSYRKFINNEEVIRCKQ